MVQVETEDEHCCCVEEQEEELEVVQSVHAKDTLADVSKQAAHTFATLILELTVLACTLGSSTTLYSKEVYIFELLLFLYT